MEAKLLQIFLRIFWPYQRSGRNVQPVDGAGQKNAERSAAREQRQRFHLAALEFSHAVVARKQCLAFGDVERAVNLEAPGIERDCDVIDEEIIAGEIKIDQAR